MMHTTIDENPIRSVMECIISVSIEVFGLSSGTGSLAKQYRLILTRKVSMMWHSKTAVRPCAPFHYVLAFLT